MSSTTVRNRRKAVALEEAAELIRESKPDTFRLDEAFREALIEDEAKIVALVYELAETVVRQDRALDHLVDHVLPGIDADMKLLREKVAAKTQTKKPRKE